jgi:ribosomal protein S18 acetylase RimI-like enzyme
VPWRPMTPEDFTAVKALADAIHLDHPEDMDVFVERQGLYPQGSHVLVDDGCMIGYALTHPWILGEPPSLNARLGALPPRPSTYYVHDLALSPGARGKDHASKAVEMLVRHARENGFANLSLVAVKGSQNFWKRMDFQIKAIPGLERKLASYGSDAVFMVRNLTGLMG